jgi:hypothetical protein
MAAPVGRFLRHFRRPALYYTAEAFRSTCRISSGCSAPTTTILFLSLSDQTPDYSFYVKEDVGAIIAKTTPPFVIFSVDESSITGSFWYYAKILLGKAGPARCRSVIRSPC